MGANAQTSVPAFTAGQVLTAAQMTQVNTGIPVFASSTERDAAFGGAGEKTLAEGQTAYLEDTDEIQYYDGSAWAALGGGGKILQIVRATDTTNRTTTSTTFVDASISVTITPTDATSNILIIWSSWIVGYSGTNNIFMTQITDSSNVAISGAELEHNGNSGTTTSYHGVKMFAWDSPATTSATTYKGRFHANPGGTTAEISNSSMTGQMFAIEVGA